MNHLPLCFLLALTPLAPTQDLLVSSRHSDEVLLYDSAGRFVRSFVAGGGLDNPVGITFGPDGHLYVASGETHQVLRYDGATGAFLGSATNGGPLRAPRQVNFGPDGQLYVCSGGTDQVLRYDAATGAYLGIAAQDARLRGPTSMTFGPDGTLYCGSVLTNLVIRFDPRTGAALGVFASTRLSFTHDVSFGPDGILYVSNATGPDKVVRFDGTTGAFIDVFVTDPALQAPLGLTWTHDGDLLVANQTGNDVRRYDGANGSLRSVQVAPGAGGLNGPLFAIHAPRRTAFAAITPTPAGVGRPVHFPLAGARPGSFVIHTAGTTTADLRLPCGGDRFRIGDPLVLAFGIADEAGNLVFRFTVPAVLAGARIRLQAVGLDPCSVSTLVEHTF